MEKVRLNKYLSECGVCSRRVADRYILSGEVTVDGHVAQMGEKVRAGQDIRLGNTRVERQSREILLVFYKPRGLVCTEEKREKNNVADYLHYPTRVFTVGRLDKDSEGLLLLTNQGELADQVMRGRYRHEKEYLVTVDREVNEEFLSAMAAGIPILGTVTRKCQVKKTGRRSFRIILTQGLNRQIRRMCEYLGYQVVKLKRTRVVNIRIGELRPGEYREATREEKEKLYRILYSAPHAFAVKNGGAEHIY